MVKGFEIKRQWRGEFTGRILILEQFMKLLRNRKIKAVKEVVFLDTLFCLFMSNHYPSLPCFGPGRLTNMHSINKLPFPLARVGCGQWGGDEKPGGRRLRDICSPAPSLPWCAGLAESIYCKLPLLSESSLHSLSGFWEIYPPLPT